MFFVKRMKSVCNAVLRVAVQVIKNIVNGIVHPKGQELRIESALEARQDWVRAQYPVHF
jgi:hypothetical protein